MRPVVSKHVAALLLIEQLQRASGLRLAVLWVQLEGNLVKWQKWQFRLGFNFREGVVLHNVG